ncbi:uncharacterized protein MYCFIDRAFT_84833 [Pseudocercospora fijiensis CIRAD86]|uniref:Uncharacterized protein n=1 Tax=Pseudocercospora fijiensis (strain CIRAD86) TaxID=383855 RepID=M2ZF37_PSEFD|nr:uncharacterized protein MYCFIDRAFT_84833 [Pseudocercospora fijiensis CIRAD86]EME77734.1 hypothetical protein MYCFIDRAFT_84833 [Pseudocercospora fijiensis CIRAD86]
MESVSPKNARGTSAPNMPAAPVIPSAASKVFGILELFELIIFLYGCSDADIDDEGYITRPSLGLYRLQRVNHTFRDHIANSKKLRRLMFLAPVDYYPRPPNRLQNYAPLTWFLEHLRPGRLGNASRRKQKQHATFQYHHPKTTVRELSQNRGMLHLEKTSREASWRKMKICNSMDAALLSPIHFLNYQYDSDLIRECFEFEKLAVERQCPAESTLGDFWDVYMALETGLTEVVMAFEQYRSVKLAEREVFKAQVNANPSRYMVYAMKYKWDYDDRPFFNRLDEHIGAFSIWQESGAGRDNEDFEDDDLV